MNAIKATFKNGQIVLDDPPDWPEGCRLQVVPVSTDRISDATDSDEPETSEEIEDWLRWYRSLEPLELTPEEEADLAAWRKKMHQYGIAKSQQRMEELFP